MRILMFGDSHGNDRYFSSICRAAVEQNCDRILQLGDFGYWEHYKEGKGYLRWCEQQLKEKNLECYWIDGNHENHPLLWSTYGPGGKSYKPDMQGFWEVRENLYYLPRGHRWVWDDVSFLALGGAYSVDKEWRVKGSSWWPEEMITDEDIEKASRGGKVDVLVSHDCPVEIDIPCLRAYDKNQYPQSRNNREMLSEVVRTTLPAFLIHGHYHDRYSDKMRVPAGLDDQGGQLWHKVQVEGLAADQSPFQETHVVFDTAQFRTARGSG